MSYPVLQQYLARLSGREGGASTGIRLDARLLGEGAEGGAEAALAGLLRQCHEAGTALLFRQVETLPALAALYRIAAQAGLPLLAQGRLLGEPQAALRSTAVARAAAA